MNQAGKASTPFILFMGVLVGTVVGAIATYFVVQSQGRSSEVSAHWVATVDGEPLSAKAYREKVAQLGTGEALQLTTRETRARVLDELVDVHLLARSASRQGLFYSNEQLQQSLRDALIAELSKEFDSPSQAELKRYYAEQGAQFRAPARIHIQRMVFRGPEALKTANKVHALLDDGADFASVKAQYASPDLLALPSELIGADQLVELLGEEVGAVVVHLPRGAITEPLEEQGGYAILNVYDNEPARKPPLSTIRSQVLERYHQYQGEQALASVLLELRNAATLRVNEEFAQSNSGE